jgi:radical SAM/Cys-rich protein
MDHVLSALAHRGIGALDITGGAPELNPHLRYLIKMARGLGKRIIARTNLTVLSEPGLRGMPRFYADHGVEVIASMPGWTEEDVDGARGKGVFKKSIAALRELNSLGYGSGPLRLGLAYNRPGTRLPPAQDALEKKFRREMTEGHGVSFDYLLTLTNMPLGRLADYLAGTGGLGNYMSRLARSFNPATLGCLMCRSLLSVGWDGRLYDCDFNQMAGRPMGHIKDFDYDRLSRREIAVEQHCFGCTALQGST